MTELLNVRADAGSPPRARRHRRWLWLAAAATAVVLVVVLLWFQPQKLFIVERVEEAIPAATRDTSTASLPPSDAAGTAEATEPVDLARGEFVSLDHGTRGVARVLELADGSRIVRLEGLDTSNGPDLFLYLSTNPADGEEGAFGDDFVNLGRLKGNQGDQNYDLSADVDLTLYASVVIWCHRFSSAFGAADLTAA